MTTAQIYFFLDIAATILEDFFILYIMREKEHPPKSKFKEFLMYFSHILLIEIITFFFNNYILKISVTILIFTFFAANIYNIPKPYAAVKITMWQTVLIFSEVLLFTAISIFNIDFMVDIDGISYPHFYIYIFSHLITFIFTVLAKKISKRFSQKALSWKNSLPLIVLCISLSMLFASIMWSLLGHYSEAYFYVFLLLGIAMVVISIGLNLYISAKESNAKFNAKLERQKLEELELKYAYYDEKLKEEERVRRIYHDMKNHLLLLGTQDADNEYTQNIIASLQEQISGYDSFMHTGNTFLDVIIRDKAQKAQKQQIDFTAMLHFEDGSFIDPLDISTIFGNALDNAIEASVKLPISERFISIKCNRFRDMITIAVENNIAGQAIYNIEKTTKQDNFLHGFGIGNIKKAVAKYNGECTSEISEKHFKLNIIIPIAA